MAQRIEDSPKMFGADQYARELAKELDATNTRIDNNVLPIAIVEEESYTVAEGVSVYIPKTFTMGAILMEKATTTDKVRHIWMPNVKDETASNPIGSWTTRKYNSDGGYDEITVTAKFGTTTTKNSVTLLRVTAIAGETPAGIAVYVKKEV